MLIACSELKRSHTRQLAKHLRSGHLNLNLSLSKLNMVHFYERWQNHTYACQTHGEDDAVASVALCAEHLKQ